MAFSSTANAREPFVTVRPNSGGMLDHMGSRAVSAPTQRQRPSTDSGCCGSCFETLPQEPREPNWVYVGKGQGGYEKVVKTYTYVGAGAGSFDKEPVPSCCETWGRRICLCMLCFFSLLLLAAAIYYTWEWLISRRAYDCEDGADKWETDWAEKRQKWCCAHKNFACNVPDPASLASHKKALAEAEDAKAKEPFDCKAGIDNWRMGWAPGKQDWCCEHKEVACIETTTSAKPFDCNETNLDIAKWSVDKKAYCCESVGRGCPSTFKTTTTFTTTSIPVEAKDWPDDEPADVDVADATIHISAVASTFSPTRPPILGYCTGKCQMPDGAIANCGARVQHEANTRFKNHLGDKCKPALAYVRVECEATCSRCTLDEAGCKDDLEQ